MASITIKLADPFPWASGTTTTEIKIKAPRGGLYATLGEPRVLVYTPSGSGYYVDNVEVVRAYMERLVEHDLGADVLNHLSLEDAKAVKEAVLSFFTEAEAGLLAKRATP